MNYIRLRQNNLCVENITTLKLTKKYKTPFYCYSLSQLKYNFNSFGNIFKTIKPLICFSVKSNSNLTLLKELKKIGLLYKTKGKKEAIEEGLFLFSKKSKAFLSKILLLTEKKKNGRELKHLKNCF